MTRALRVLAGVRGEDLTVAASRRLSFATLPAGAMPPAAVGSVHIEAASTAGLYRCLASELARVRARRVSIVVRDWRPPRPGWTGQLGPLPGLLRSEVTVAGRQVTIRVRLARGTPLHMVLSAAIEVVAPQARTPVPASVDLATYDAPADWLPPTVNTAGFVGLEPDEEMVRPYDVLLSAESRLARTAGLAGAHSSLGPGERLARTAGLAGAHSSLGPGERLARTAGLAGAHSSLGPGERAQVAGGAIEVRTAPSGVITAAGDRVLVDTGQVNPRGYRVPAPSAPAGAVGAAGGRWSVTVDGVERCGGRFGEPSNDGDAAALRGLRFVVVDGLSGTAAAAEAALVVRLAMLGVVLHAPAMPAETARRVAPELRAILAEELPREGASAGPDDFAWELRSVRQRRAAMRGHGSGFALPAAVDVIPAAQRLPSVTALLAGDEASVPGLLTAFAAQTYPAVELVLGLPAMGSSEATATAIAEYRRPIEVVESTDLAVLAQHARGTLVTAIDSRYGYGPEHLWDLVVAQQFAAPTVTGKAAEFLYLADQDITVRQRLLSEDYAAAVSPAAMLLTRRDLEAFGGWTAGLLARVQRTGGLVYRTHALGFVSPRATAPPAAIPQWTGWPTDREFVGSSA